MPMQHGNPLPFPAPKRDLYDDLSPFWLPSLRPSQPTKTKRDTADLEIPNFVSAFPQRGLQTVKHSTHTYNKYYYYLLLVLALHEVVRY